MANGATWFRWNLLKKRLVEVCPSYLSTSVIDYYRQENQPSKPADEYLFKFWCSYDQKGLLHDVAEVLSKLELTIKRVKVSTAPDGRVMDLFFVADTRDLLHSKERQEETIDRLRDVLGDALVSREIELAHSEVAAGSGGSLFLPPTINEGMFNLETPDQLQRSGFLAPNTVSVNMGNSLSRSHTLLHIHCKDHNGLVYDITRTLKDYNIHVSK